MLLVRTTFNETAALLGHFLGLFLTHRPTQHIRTAEGVAGHATWAICITCS